MRKISLMAAAAAAAFGSTAFAASSTHTVNVSAQVTGNCRFNDAGPTALVIENDGTAIDPSDPTTATGQATIAYRCTNGITASIAADVGVHDNAGQRRVALADDSEFMDYSLTLTGAAQTGIGYGSGGDLTLTLDASIVSGQFQNVSAGAYDDTVVLTITP